MKPSKSRNKGDLKGREKLNGKRIPRPMGLTYQILSLKNKETGTINTEQLEEVKRKIVEQWSSSGMILNGKIYTLEQLASYLNMETNRVYKYMWGAMKKVGKVIERKDAGDLAREIFGIALKKTTEIGALSLHQVQILMGDQDGHYKPFLSSAVNQALGNLNATQAPLLALLRTLTEKQETNIIFNTNNTLINNQTINQEGAMKIISAQQQSMLEAPNMADSALAIIAQSGTLPDINPRTQDVGTITKIKYFEGAHPGIPNEANPSKSHDHLGRREVKEKVWDKAEDSDEFKA